MQQLIELLAGSSTDHPLDLAALQIASIEFPALDPQPFLDLLDSYSREIAASVHSSASPEEYIRVANHLLFEQEGFSGNEDDYYNPLNSCLNEVLASKRGIPITLSLVYVEIARRLGRPISGIGLPGHFLVRYEDGAFSAFIDPFHKGRILSIDECRTLAIQVARVDIFAVPSALAPVDKRQFLARMLNNLRHSYYRRNEFQKAIRVHDVLIEAAPQAPVEYRQRAALYLQEKRYKAALLDLETYLRLAPNAADRQAVQRQIEELRQYLQSVN